MATTISFNYEDKRYVLEYDRRTVIELENKGFNPSKVDEQPTKSIFMLWTGAFEKHHSNVSIAKREEILAALGNKEELFQTLVQMYIEPAQMLSDSGEDGKKVKWELNKG